MPLPDEWASPEDFATLFQYFWHRDFPIGNQAPGAKRVDWTIHVGIVVRNIADLMGLVARFESGGRKDSILRSVEGDEIAVEWEWGDIKQGNELKKLREHSVWSRVKVHNRLRYAVLLTYAQLGDTEDLCGHARDAWKGAPWPLLLILIVSQTNKKLRSGREFKNIQMCLFDGVCQRMIRCVPAFPWKVDSSRWSVQQMDL